MNYFFWAFGLGALSAISLPLGSWIGLRFGFSSRTISVLAAFGAGELFAMSGLRNPYLDGPLGVIMEGAYADLLLVDGNPLEDLKAVTNSDNLKIIMKDGMIYKNTL